ERVASRAVDVEGAVVAEGAGTVGEELPAAFADLPGLRGLLELIAGPHDGPLGRGVESVRVEQGPLVVVAEEDQLAVHHQVDALAGVRAVADDVPEAVNAFIRVLLGNVVQDGLECFQVAVDIADDGLHAWTLPDTIRLIIDRLRLGMRSGKG